MDDRLHANATQIIEGKSPEEVSKLIQVIDQEVDSIDFTNYMADYFRTAGDFVADEERGRIGELDLADWPGVKTSMSYLLTRCSTLLSTDLVRRITEVLEFVDDYIKTLKEDPIMWVQQALPVRYSMTANTLRVIRVADGNAVCTNSQVFFGYEGITKDAEPLTTEVDGNGVSNVKFPEWKRYIDNKGELLRTLRANNVDGSPDIKSFMSGGDTYLVSNEWLCRARLGMKKIKYYLTRGEFPRLLVYCEKSHRWASIPLTAG